MDTKLNRKIKNAFNYGQRFLSVETKYIWIVFKCDYDRHTEVWNYGLIQAQTGTKVDRTSVEIYNAIRNKKLELN